MEYPWILHRHPQIFQPSVFFRFELPMEVEKELLRCIVINFRCASFASSWCFCVFVSFNFKTQDHLSGGKSRWRQPQKPHDWCVRFVHNLLCLTRVRLLLTFTQHLLVVGGRLRGNRESSRAQMIFIGENLRNWPVQDRPSSDRETCSNTFDFRRP